HRPWCVSGGVRSDPAVGEHLCPIRARVLVGDGGPTAVGASVTAAGTRRWEASSVLSWRAPQQPRAEAVYLCVRGGRRSRSAEGLVGGGGQRGGEGGEGGRGPAAPLGLTPPSGPRRSRWSPGRWGVSPMTTACPA